MRLLIILLLGLNFFIGCTNPKFEYSEMTFVKTATNDSFVVRSYDHLDLDSVWRYSLNEELVASYTAYGKDGCDGKVEIRWFSGELRGYGNCVDGRYDGMWKFYKKSGELHFLNFYSRDLFYQRWILDSGDTSKWLYPIIKVEPMTAYVFDTVSVIVDYIFEGIDTTNWDFYVLFDFVERNRFEDASPLPYEQYVMKYEGQPIIKKLGFIVPGEMVLYGQTMAVNRISSDTIFHPEIVNRFLTILDSTSVEL